MKQGGERARVGHLDQQTEHSPSERRPIFTHWRGFGRGLSPRYQGASKASELSSVAVIYLRESTVSHAKIDAKCFPLGEGSPASTAVAQLSVQAYKTHFFLQFFARPMSLGRRRLIGFFPKIRSSNPGLRQGKV